MDLVINTIVVAKTHLRNCTNPNHKRANLTVEGGYHIFLYSRHNPDLDLGSGFKSSLKLLLA